MDNEQAQQDDDSQGAWNHEEERSREDEHPCDDVCQLLEHKGYHTCQQAGCCQYEKAFGGSPHG